MNDAWFLYLVGYGLGAVLVVTALYWLIRLSVRAAIRDVFPPKDHAQRQPSAPSSDEEHAGW